jgi:hypothetical protein
MSFARSALFGEPGQYKQFGIDTSYSSSQQCPVTDLDGAGPISDLATTVLKSRRFRVFTQGYLQVNVHELGHALAYKFFTGSNPRIIIDTSTCTGTTEPYAETDKLPPWKQTVTDLAGPLASVALSSCKIVAFVALRNYITWPFALALGASNALWIAGEFLLAGVSVKAALEDTAPQPVKTKLASFASPREENDFYAITKRGSAHLKAAAAALIATASLGIYTALKML